MHCMKDKKSKRRKVIIISQIIIPSSSSEYSISMSDFFSSGLLLNQLFIISQCDEQYSNDEGGEILRKKEAMTNVSLFIVLSFLLTS